MTLPSDSFTKLLNVGCGHCYHTDWTNIDLVDHGPEVRGYDLRQGLPYDDGSFDAVYHSHVLEHLTPEEARAMLAECCRVLRVGGVMRVVVPDLEGIATAYLQSVEAAASGDAVAKANHHWMTLELVDQMTRQRGGGQMGRVMNHPETINRDFIRTRIGGQMDDGPKNGIKKTLRQRASRTLAGFRKQLSLAAVTLFDGKVGRAAYREGRFRQSGEIHRWMYDRVSLAMLMTDVGLRQVTVCQADQSSITDFDGYQLDRVGSVARKPDSLYMEGRRAAADQAPFVSRASNKAA